MPCQQDDKMVVICMISQEKGMLNVCKKLFFSHILHAIVLRYIHTLIV